MLGRVGPVELVGMGLCGWGDLEVVGENFVAASDSRPGEGGQFSTFHL